jgi:WD40 repeat protein
MSRGKRIVGLAATLAVLAVWCGLARAEDPPGRKGKPLTEADVLRLIELQKEEGAILARLEAAGVGFPVDDALAARLKKAGASAEVLAAVRRAAERAEAKAPPRGPVKEVQVLAPVEQVYTTPDLSRMAVASGTTVELWDLRRGKRLWEQKDHPRKVHALAVSPNKEVVAVGCYKHVVLRNGQTGADDKTLKGHDSDVDCLSFSPDGKYLATGSSSDGTVRVWDVGKGEQVWLARNASSRRYLRVRYLPNGKLAAWNMFFLLVWDAPHTKPEKPEVKIQRPETVYWGKPRIGWVFSHDCKRLAFGGHEHVDLYDVATGKEEATLNGHTEEVTDLAFSRDGKWLASGSWDGTAIVWDLATPPKEHGVQKGLKGHVWLAYSPDSRLLLVAAKGDKEIRVCDGATGNKVGSIEKPRELLWGLSEDGKGLLVLSSQDGRARVYDPAALRVKR